MIVHRVKVGRTPEEPTSGDGRVLASRLAISRTLSWRPTIAAEKGRRRETAPLLDVGDVALSKARTKKDAVNLALRYYADRQERAARIGRHFERARHWGAVEDAERLHQAEKEVR
jgi:hypothetical protein